MIEIINQVFAIEAKMKKENISSVDRYLERIYNEIETMGYQVVNPLGQTYRNEMTDLEANVLGDLSKSSKVVKVLKPVIYDVEDNKPRLLQKGIVIVE